MPCLVIGVRFYDGRYHGTGRWPPSPARLFQALVAGAARGENLAAEDKAALAWLESLDPPLITAPAVRAGQGFRTFVPNNDLDAVGGDPRRIGEIRAAKQIRPLLFGAETPLLYVWRFADGPAAQARAKRVCAIAERLYQLGRGVDMACAWGEDAAAEEAEARLAAHGGVLHRPGGGADTTLAVPIVGSLESLVERYRETRQRFRRGAAGQIFSQPRKPRFAEAYYDSPPLRLLFAVRSAASQSAEPEFSPWPLARAVELVTMIRDAAAARLQNKLSNKAVLIERVVIGRGATEADKAARVRIVPLPSIGHIHADHAIRRILVEIPPNCPLRGDDLEWGFSGLHLGADYRTGEVTDENRPVLTIQVERGMLGHYAIEPPGAVRVWRTATPAALPQAAARRRIDPAKLHDPDAQKRAPERTVEQDRAAVAVLQAVRHAGRAARVAAIQVQREPFAGNGERAESFAARTRFAPERLWHVEIAFAQPVAGPLVIGDGRYLGLGVMTPAAEIRPDVAIFGLGAEPRIAVDDRAEFLMAVRRALMSLSRRENGGIPRLFSGHEADGRAARSGKHEHVFLAAADRDGDGYVDKLIVAAPWRCDRSVDPGYDDPVLFDRIVSSLVLVRAGKLGVVPLHIEEFGCDERWLVGQARQWRSHTRFRATRPVRRDDDPVEVLRRDVLGECRRRGLPAPEVELLDCSTDRHERVGGLVRLSFAVGILGPVILGRDSHRGGGLFLAVPALADGAAA